MDSFEAGAGFSAPVIKGFIFVLFAVMTIVFSIWGVKRGVALKKGSNAFELGKVLFNVFLIIVFVIFLTTVL